jgi:septum formation topological specificity factor MinE
LDKSTFIFKKARYQPELTGKKARDIKEFLEIIKNIEESSLFYHIHHALLDHHLVPLEYPNDFAYWIADELREPELAEKLVNIDILEMNLNRLRLTIIKIIEEYMQQHPMIDRVHEGHEFYFVKCTTVTFPTKYSASNIIEFLDALSKIDSDSLFYHFFATRLLYNRETNDLSNWILTNTGNKELADKLARLDPYSFTNLDALQVEIIKIIEKYIAR